ncbi:mitochondrial fission factor-like isoform X1 [Salvelinus fontinalis]|uniref:mitochondrial fission factor-like isoform X1 n=1 Tax=Salvelinus fontinalis TaxID=8038 RepID=UPI0024850E24|nr:mitochondrial fission factor-like isoform X1 [Salvelinus fontinalis]XP_055798249.1 mitochondrial fission factor-like isoform X1 [Salvelinus fontinalis]XP_055798250.1 mitochondrial fission factor-like isoform X1 [Salvelinus fontinalis]
MASSGFRGDVSQVRGGRDPVFSEAINQKMRVPDRLRVGPGMGQGGEEARQGRAESPASYSMHIPDRLSLTDAPDMSPRPLFTSSKHNLALPLGLAWEAQQQAAWERDPYMREPVQSPLRRSYSDQAFGRSDPDTPTSKQALHTPTFRGGAGCPPKRSAAAANPMPLGLPAIPPSHLSPTAMLQAAKELGQQASQRLLQTVTQKYRFSYPEHPTTAVVEAPPVYVEPARKSVMQDSWMSPDDEGSAAAVEFIVLRRQVVKMSRRLAGLERQNAECRQTELVLFSLLISACLLNGWLWIRR